MRQPKINRERGERADIALKGGNYETPEDREAAIADILCDLRHLCDRYGYDFGQLCDRGYSNYCAELHPDDIEQDARRMHRRGDYPILPKEACHG
jgi:hypothetical protein